jgi:hypothetical protein
MYQSLLSRLLSKPPQTSLGETEVAGAGSRSPSRQSIYHSTSLFEHFAHHVSFIL